MPCVSLSHAGSLTDEIQDGSPLTIYYVNFGKVLSYSAYLDIGELLNRGKWRYVPSHGSCGCPFWKLEILYKIVSWQSVHKMLIKTNGYLKKMGNLNKVKQNLKNISMWHNLKVGNRISSDSTKFYFLLN